VGPNPSYTGVDKIFTACCSILSSILRLDGFPRSPWTTALSPPSFSPYSSRCTCRMLNLNSSAASRCVISSFLAFFSVTSRSLSAWVMSSCPSCIPQAWGCQDDISTLLKGDIITLLPQIATDRLLPTDGYQQIRRRFAAGRIPEISCSVDGH